MRLSEGYECVACPAKNLHGSTDNAHLLHESDWHQSNERNGHDANAHANKVPERLEPHTPVRASNRLEAD